MKTNKKSNIDPQISIIFYEGEKMTQNRWKPIERFYLEWRP